MIPTAADADWSTAVKTAPARMPSRGFDMEMSMVRNPGASPREETAPDMELIPNIRTAKPIMMSPTCRSVCFFENIRNRIPTSATDAVRVAVENMLAMPLPPPTVLRQMIQPVIDVPRIAPRMTLTACRTFIIPELTNPTVITDVAQDDG